MRMNKSLSSSLVAAAVLALAPQVASAWSPKLEVSETTWVQLGYLHQFWYESVEDKNVGSRSSDFFTRRSRVMLLGQATETIHFFLNYDAAAGAATESAGSPVLTDAIIDYRIAPEFVFSVGRILVPFSIDNNTSAVTLTGIDYPTRALVNQPTFPGGAFWRDDGVQVRGLLGGGRVDYRVGYFRGDRNAARNPKGDGRITGMLIFNLASPQGGWFFNQNSLGALDVLSFGVGFDQVSRSGTGFDDHEAFSVFFTAEKSLGGGHLSANAAYYDWEGVTGSVALPATGAFYNGGNTSVLALAYLPSGSKWQPVVRWQQQDPDDGSKLDTIGIGLSYYISGHRANIKAEYSIDDQFVGTSKVDAFRIQAQLFF